MAYFKHILKLIAGLFVTDKNLSIPHRTLQFISRFSWEIIQTSFGFIAALFVLLANKSKAVLFSNGSTVVVLKSRFGAFTLAHIIVGDNEIDAYPTQRLFQHEYGHYLQSMRCGPLYLFKYGLPSVISAWRNEFYEHMRQPVEQDANTRAKTYFDFHYQQAYRWDHKYNPIYKEVVPASLQWYDFVPVYFPVVHCVKAFKK